MSIRLSRLLFAASLAALTLAGCGLQSFPDPTAPAKSISASEFETVTQSDKLTLIKFGATWCGPCVKVDRELDKLESTLSPDVAILKIDVDVNEDLAREFQITSIPRMMLVRSGEVLDDRIGYASASELTQWVEEKR